MSVVKSLDDGAPKTPKRIKKAAPKKTATVVVHAEKVIVPAPATEIQATTEPVIIQTTAPVNEVHQESTASHTIEDVEQKAVGLWGKIKEWKYRWFVVVGLALLILGYLFLSNFIRNRQNQKSEEKIEAKKEELHQIEVGGDTSILKQRILESDRMKLIDSIYNATLHALTDLKKVIDYQKLTLPKQSDIINGEYIRAHENINNPANTDDDVRRNAEGQMSKRNRDEQTIPKR